MNQKKIFSDIVAKYRNSNDLVLSNLSFVFSVATIYANKNKNIDIFDLVQEGVLGLLIAKERYKENSKTKFISFAVHYIRMNMVAYMAKNKFKFNVNPYVYNKVYRIINKKNGNENIEGYDTLIKYVQNERDFIDSRVDDYSDNKPSDCLSSLNKEDIKNIIQNVLWSMDKIYSIYVDNGLFINDVRFKNYCKNNDISCNEIRNIKRRFKLRFIDAMLKLYRVNGFDRLKGLIDV